MATSDQSPEASSNPLTSSAEDTPANHSAKLESAAAPMIQGIFGPSLRDYFAYFDLDTCSWKTSQDTLVLGLEQFSETWPDSGTMRSGRAYVRVISEQPISESESLSWRTPNTRDYHAGGPRLDAKQRQVCLVDQVGTWPTARSEDGESAGNHPGATDSLTGATRTWTTPTATERSGQGERNSALTLDVKNWKTPHGMSNRDSKGKVGGAGGGEFALQANHWQTPATDSFRSRGGDRKDEMGLDQQARFFPTPQAADGKMVKGGKRGADSNPSLGTAASSLQDHLTPGGPESSQNDRTWPRRLNPQFVEWLMGFPIGWSKP